MFELQLLQTTSQRRLLGSYFEYTIESSEIGSRAFQPPVAEAATAKAGRRDFVKPACR